MKLYRKDKKNSGEISHPPICRRKYFFVVFTETANPLKWYSLVVSLNRWTFLGVCWVPSPPLFSYPNDIPFLRESKIINLTPPSLKMDRGVKEECLPCFKTGENQVLKQINGAQTGHNERENGIWQLIALSVQLKDALGLPHRRFHMDWLQILPIFLEKGYKKIDGECDVQPVQGVKRKKIKTMTYFKSSALISTCPTQQPMHSTFFSWNLIVERISVTFPMMSSPPLRAVGNFPARFMWGPRNNKKWEGDKMLSAANRQYEESAWWGSRMPGKHRTRCRVSSPASCSCSVFSGHQLCAWAPEALWLHLRGLRRRWCKLWILGEPLEEAWLNPKTVCLSVCRSSSSWPKTGEIHTFLMALEPEGPRSLETFGQACQTCRCGIQSRWTVLRSGVYLDWSSTWSLDKT